MSAISFFEFRNALDRNQEIEFSLFDRQYFATPRTDPPEEQLYAQRRDEVGGRALLPVFRRR